MLGAVQMLVGEECGGKLMSYKTKLCHLDNTYGQNTIMPMDDHNSTELESQSNCMEHGKNEQLGIFTTRSVSMEQNDQFLDNLHPKDREILEQHSIRSLQDIVMMTVIDVEGLKLPIGLRNKLLDIIREYTVSRQGTKRGAEEKLWEMSSKHAKLGNVGNVTQGPTASGDGGSSSAKPSGLAHIGQAADGLILAKGVHVQLVNPT